MRKWLFILFLLFSGNASAEWTLVAVSEDANDYYYVDNDTIRRSGNRVKMWTLMDRKIPEKVGDRFYTSSKKQKEYDCKEETNRLVAIVFYADAMGSGKVIDSSTYTIQQAPFEPIVPESIQETLFKYACRKK